MATEGGLRSSISACDLAASFADASVAAIIYTGIGRDMPAGWIASNRRAGKRLIATPVGASWRAVPQDLLTCDGVPLEPVSKA